MSLLTWENFTLGELICYQTAIKIHGKTLAGYVSKMLAERFKYNIAFPQQNDVSLKRPRY